MTRRFGLVSFFAVLSLFFFSGCSLFGQKSDAPVAPMDDKSEYAILLEKTQKDIQGKVASFISVVPEKYEGEGNVNFAVKSDKIPGGRMNLSIGYNGKTNMVGWKEDINNLKSFYDTVIKFSGSVPLPSFGILNDAVISFSLQQMGEKYFFSLKDVSYALFSGDGEALPEVDFSSVKGNIYEVVYADFLKKIGVVSSVNPVSLKDSLEMFRLIESTLSQNPIPLRFEQKLSEEGTRVTYSVSLDKEIVKKDLAPIVDYIQKSLDSQALPGGEAVNMRADMEKAVDELSYAGTLILDRENASYFEVEGTFSSAYSSQDVLLSFSFSGGSVLLKLSEKETLKELFVLGYKDNVITVSSEGALFTMENGNGEITGSLSLLSSKLAEFSLLKSAQDETWAGTISILTGEKPMVINVKDMIFAREIMKGEFSLDDESLGSIALSYSFAISPSENVSIEEPQNAQSIDLFFQNISSIILGGIGSMPVSDLEVSPVPILETSPEVSLDIVPVE